MSSEPVIRLRNLGKCYHIYEKPRDRLLQMLYRGRKQYYREFWALKDIGLEVMPGEVMGIVGSNGSGKSTLLQLVCGILNPTGGEVSVQGRVAALLELGAGFNPEFSGRENVFLSAAVIGLSPEEAKARFEDIVEFSGIRDFIDQPVKTYSSGMYVRLAFSIATSVDPDILVVDEALSVGDGEFARRSFDRIMGLKEKGKTILFCSHSLYQVEAFCDRVLWLDHGQCAMLGSPHDVIGQYNAFILNGAQASPRKEVLPPDPPDKHQATAPGEEAARPQGHARFTSVEVAMDGVAGRHLKGQSCLSSLSVSLCFESDPAFPPPTVGVTLDYGSLLAVTCAVSRTDKIALQRNSQGRGEVEITFPNLSLRKGNYLVGAYLGCENALHFYDSVLGVAEFEIEDAFPEPGLVVLPHQWRSVAAPLEESRQAGWHQAVLANGRPFWVDRDDSLGILANGVFEPEESLLCQSLIRPGDRVLDVGANAGYFSVLFAECLGSAGVIHAFEPDPDNFALLSANTKDFADAGRIVLHKLALSNQAGIASLFKSKDNVGMHRLYESVCCEGLISVKASRGDALGLAPVDFIKIDIEGYEPFALQGLETTLQNSPEVKILCEWSPLSMLEAGALPTQFLSWMSNLGFHPLAWDGSCWSAAACGDLPEQAEKLERLNMKEFCASLKTADQQAIIAAAEQIMIACDYGRPVLENLLFVRQESFVMPLGRSEPPGSTGSRH